MSNTTPRCLENKTFAEINPGDSASLSRTLTRQNIQLFALVSGDINPAILDERYTRDVLFHQITAHGMWIDSLFSTLFNTQLPGPGSSIVSQTRSFLRQTHVGDTITAIITATHKDDAKQQITFRTVCTNGDNKPVAEGETVVQAPANKICWEAAPLPNIMLQADDHHYEAWLRDKAAGLAPLKTAVVHPVDRFSLEGAILAAREGIIAPILIGPEEKIRATALDAGIDLASYPIIPTKHSHAAADKAVEMARAGEVEALMKGKLSTEELMEAVINKDKGLRTGRRMSHVFALDVPSYPKPLFLTDAAINIAPTLMEKKDIIQNAVDLFHTLGLGTPRVAVLSAVETVNEKIPSTLDATGLSKMAERGQIKGAIVDGPLAFDNAISLEAATIKGIRSEVAGNADILVVPDIESGNMLYKQLRYFSGVQGAGLVLGARVPIILTSRASAGEDRIASCALALLYTRNKSAASVS